MKTRILTALIFSSLWATTTVPAAFAAPPSGTDQATLVGTQGQIVGSWDLGFGFEAVATAGLAGVTVTFPNGDKVYLPGTNIASEVLLGNVAGSVPAPLRAPPMSVASLSSPTLDVQTPLAAGLSFSPPGATMGGSFRVIVNVFPPRGITGPGVLSLSVDGGPEQITAIDDWEAFTAREGGAASVTFVENGAHSIVARVTHAGTETVVEGTWLIDATDDAVRRDTDGDGIADVTEVALSLDPFRNDLGDDRDLDGWSDFDEVLRGSSPTLASSIPLDSDGDGWSDQDEVWRRTEPLDASSFPTARSLNAVEYVVTIETYADVPMSTPHPGMGIGFLAAGASGRALGFAAGAQRGDVDLSDPAGLSLLSGVTPWSELTGAYETTASDEMGPVRVPGDESVLVSVRADGIGTELRRSWLIGTPDATPSLIAGLAAQLPPDLSTDVLANYKTALATYLVQTRTARQHPQSSLGVNLIAATVAWAAEIEGLAPVLLQPDDGTVCGEHRSRLGGRYDDLVRYGGAPPPGAPAATALATAMWASPEPDETTAKSEARLLQRALPGTDLATLRYHAWLIAYAGLDAVLGYAIPIQPGVETSPWNPGADSDLDGITNEAELAPGLASATDPLYPDTDDDGLGDLGDPCPRDSANHCMVDDALGQDTDGDGVIDAIDNCWRVSNATQKDLNQDGIGDACSAVAQIVVPATDLAVLPGTHLTLEAIVAADAAPPVNLQWKVQGASKGTGPVFSLVLDPAEWGSSTITVLLEASDGGKTLAVVDRREFRVLDIAGPVPCLALDCSDGDPCTDDGCDLATGCEHTPIPNCQACAATTDCDDGDVCTSETCSEAGTCVRAKLTGTACTDDNACTGPDLCASSGCVAGAAVTCDDGDPCTIDSCVPASGCVYLPNPTPDLVLCPQCTSDEDCGAGTCVGGACCTGSMKLDVPFVWSPGSPDPTLCLEAGTEIAVVASASAAHRVKMFSPTGTQLAFTTQAANLYYEMENPALSGAYRFTSTATVPVTYTIHTSVDEEDVVPSFGTQFATPAGTVGAEVYQRFEGTEGMRVSIQSVYSGSGCDDVALYDPLNVKIWSVFTCGTAFSDLRVLPRAGTYTIFVDTDSATGTAATTTVWVVPAEPVVVATPGGGAVNVPLTTPGLNGTVEFTASAGDRISISSAAMSCTDYALLSPSGAKLDSVFSCGFTFREPKLLTETGVYRWTINPDTTVTGTAGVTIHLLPPDPVVVGTIGGPATAVTLPVAGQNGTLNFEGVAGAAVLATFVKSGTGCPTVIIYSPSGTKLVEEYTCGTPFIDRTALPETGTYRMTLSPSSNNTGTLTVTLKDVPPDTEFLGAIGGGSVAVSNVAAGQNAALLFEATGTESIVFTGAHGSNKQAAYRLYSPSGGLVHSKSSAFTSYASPAITLTEAGTWRLVVDFPALTISSSTMTVTLSP